MSSSRGSKSYVSLLLDQTDLPFIHLKKEAFPAIEKRLNTHAVNISKQLRKARKNKEKFLKGKKANSEKYIKKCHKYNIIFTTCSYLSTLPLCTGIFYDLKLDSQHLINVHDKLATQTQLLDHTRNERDEWARQYSGLKNELEKLYEEMAIDKEKLLEEEENNAALAKYLWDIIDYESTQNNTELVKQLQEVQKKLEHVNTQAANEHTSLKHKGQPYDAVSQRRKKRQISILRTKAQKVLWCVDTYGLKMTGISLSDANNHNVEVSTDKGLTLHIL